MLLTVPSKALRVNGPQRVALHRPLMTTRCKAVVKRQQEAVAAAEEESIFLDPLVRSFLLGVGAGCVVESVHVFLKFFSFIGQHGTAADAVHALQEQVAPLFVWDHVAAVGFWALLYIIEVMAIVSVLNKYPDQETAMRQVRGMMTLSKRMLPIQLGSIKRSLYHLATASSSSAVPPAATPVPPAAVASYITTVEGPVPSEPMAFVDVQDVIADIEAQVAAAPSVPLGIPNLPPLPKVRGLADDITLKDKRDRKSLKPGQWDPELRNKMSKREQELLERKSYLRNFWYAAALSENLGYDKPLGVDILGSRVVLFREEDGSVKCLDDACPHRGAPLSEGWLATDDEPTAKGHTCVVCPYHGWAFDGEGHLRDVPSAEAGRWPKRPLVSSYPIVEKGGFIWLFWGDKQLPEDERPPIPFAPELEDPNWHPVYGEIEFECGHWPVFENAIDMAHIHYLHNDSFGNSEKPRIMDMTTKRDTFHVEANFSIHNKPVNKMWEWTAVESVPVKAKAMLPSSSAITIQLGSGVSMITFVNTVPISENRAVNRFCLIRNFAGWEGFNGYARNAMFKILGEDKVMVEKLTPERLAAEFSLGPDAPQVAFRKLRQEWIDMGYGVLPESIKPRRGLGPDM